MDLNKINGQCITYNEDIPLKLGPVFDNRTFLVQPTAAAPYSNIVYV